MAYEKWFFYIKKYSLLFGALLFSLQVFAQNSVDLTYNCTPTNNLKKIVNVAGDQLVKINNLKGRMGANNIPEFTMDAEIHSEMQIINNFNHEKLETEKVTERYMMNNVKSGMILDLKDKEERGNSLKFIYKIMRLNSYDVTTAGPIPEGTWNEKINLILITDYTADILKIDFNCKVNVKYKE